MERYAVMFTWFDFEEMTKGPDRLTLHPRVATLAGL
jgi:hypothetical protein